MGEEKRDEKEAIVVIDAGIKTDELIGPEGACCWSMIMPLD